MKINRKEKLEYKRLGERDPKLEKKRWRCQIHLEARR
jgi:hypothetical protein